VNDVLVILKFTVDYESSWDNTPTNYSGGKWGFMYDDSCDEDAMNRRQLTEGIEGTELL